MKNTKAPALAIYGSGRLGREMYDLAKQVDGNGDRWSSILFADDFETEGPYLDTSRMRLDSLNRSYPDVEYIVAVGTPLNREKIHSSLVNRGLSLATLIHPTAIVSPSAVIQSGTVVMEYVVIKSGALLCTNVLVQPQCCIGHDVTVGKHSVLSALTAPGGGSVIGERVFIGMHASSIEGISIGDDAVIGMGANVFRNVLSGQTVVGNPSRVTLRDESAPLFRNERRT